MRRLDVDISRSQECRRHFNTFAMGDPLHPDSLSFTSPETRMILLPDAENRAIVSSFIWTKDRNMTDGRTGRQTELVWLLQRFALQAVRTRCKSGHVTGRITLNDAYWHW